MSKKKTPAQHFADLFQRYMRGATPGERESGEKAVDKWLKRHGKTRADIQAILVQAAADDAASQPPPPPSDPRDARPHPFEDPQFTPAGLVEGIVAKYVTMAEHVRIVFALWICFTHVYTRFAIAPRVALNSEDPDSGKTTAKDVARHLVFRPNPEDLGTGAAIGQFLDQGPCSVLLDEVDQVDAEGRRRLQLMWNLGHKREAKYSMVIEGRRKLVSFHAPMLAAGIGRFLALSPKSRTFSFEMEGYTAETKPEREYYADDDVSDLDNVYAYLRNWAASVKLDPKPAMPPGVLRRDADNVRGLLSIADSCGPEWGRRAREAVTFLFEKQKAERPEISPLRHGLAIFDAFELDQIGTIRLNKELRQLDLPDARWTRYRGPSGMDYAHPLELHEQATLLKKVGIESTRCRPPDGGKQFRGYKRAQFEEAWRKHCGAAPEEGVGRPQLRLVKPLAD
jgi:uncharacterized protein DUF3631